MHPARLWMGMTLWACIGVQRPARADAPPVTRVDGSRSATADVLFREGRVRMESGDYGRACALFGESQRLEPSPGALFNLATCEQATGKLVAAWEHFGQLLELMPPTDDRHAIANAQRLALTHAMPWLTVSLAPGCPPDARVRRDGMELGAPSVGVALPVDPGPHEIAVAAGGHEARLYTVTVDRGEHRALSVAPGPIDVSAAAPPPLVGYGVGGIGLASLTAGAILGVRALQRQSDSAGDCSGSVCRDAAGVQAYADARTLAVASDVALGAGVVGVVAGAYLVWFEPGALSTRTSGTSGTTRASALAGWSFTATGIGVAF